MRDTEVLKPVKLLASLQLRVNLHFDSTHLLLGVWSQASKNSSDDSDETDGNLAPEGNLAPDG